MPELDMFRYQDYYKGVDQNKSTYEGDEIPACTYTARVIQEALQEKNISSKIYWIANTANQTGHAYVILDSQQDHELPYNLSQLKHEPELTVGEIRSKGEDITQEILNEPWERL